MRVTSPVTEEAPGDNSSNIEKESSRAVNKIIDLSLTGWRSSFWSGKNRLLKTFLDTKGSQKWLDSNANQCWFRERHLTLETAACIFMDSWAEHKGQDLSTPSSSGRLNWLKQSINLFKLSLFVMRKMGNGQDSNIMSSALFSWEASGTHFCFLQWEYSANSLSSLYSP